MVEGCFSFSLHSFSFLLQNFTLGFNYFFCCRCVSDCIAVRKVVYDIVCLGMFCGLFWGSWLKIRRGIVRSVLHLLASRYPCCTFFCLLIFVASHSYLPLLAMLPWVND